MSWSLRLQNGDLTLGNSHYGTVTGEQKLVQDLRCYIMERMGNDDMHPDYGSLIDGGRLPDGTEVRGAIGEMNTDLTRINIETELRRIINDYQARQLQKAKDDRATYGKTALTRGEVLLGVTDIKFSQVGDGLSIRLTLQTASNVSPDLTLSLID